MSIPQTYNNKPLVHTWSYLNTDGNALGVVARYQSGSGKKTIVPYFNHNGSCFTIGIDLNPRPLFGLEQLSKPLKPEAIFIVEGEKAAQAMQGIGLCALTSLGGSQAAKQAEWEPLSGYKAVYLLSDNDEPGEHYMQDVYSELMALERPPEVKVLKLSGLPDKGDVVDWLQNHSPGWDGYSSFPESEKSWVLSELKSGIQENAVNVPDDWGFSGFSGSRSSVFDWKNPSDIESKLPNVQALDNELIPEPFKAWLADVSHRMQTPGDFAAISNIVIVGSIIGAGCSIRPKRLDDFEVIPNLWGACIGRPSVVLKAPSMKEPMQLLERLQAEYGEQFEQERAGAEFDSLANKAVIDDIKSKLASTAKGKGKDGIVQSDDIQKLKADYLEATNNALPEPTRRLFKTNETSIQSMTLLQTQNERGLLVFRDELTGLLVKWDREDCADERAYFLEGWNGNGSYTDVKIGRGLTDAKNICISLLGGIQPDKLKRYLYQAQKGSNDGLMQRLQLAVWPDEPASWELIDTIPNKAEKQRAYDIVKALAELDFIQYGAVKGEYDDTALLSF